VRITLTVLAGTKTKCTVWIYVDSNCAGQNYVDSKCRDKISSSLCSNIVSSLPFFVRLKKIASVELKMAV
jgi:hypothetical protein